MFVLVCVGGLTPATAGAANASDSARGALCTAANMVSNLTGIRGSTILDVAGAVSCDDITPINQLRCLPQAGVYTECEWARSSPNVQAWLRDPKNRNGSKGDQFDEEALLTCVYLAHMHREYVPAMSWSRLGCLTIEVSASVVVTNNWKPDPISPPWQARPVNYREVELVRYYNAGLLRQPDQGGWDYWRVNLCPASQLTWTARNILGSAEMVQVIGARSWELPGGLWKARAVRRVYTALLNRPADAGGLSYWMSRMNNYRPDDIRIVVDGIANSPEFTSRATSACALLNPI